MASFNLLFDVKLFAAVRVQLDATDQRDAIRRAREALAEQLECVDLGIVAERDGMIIAIREASPNDDGADLVEVNGEAPDE